MRAMSYSKNSTQGMAPTHAVHCAGLGEEIIRRWKERAVFVDIWFKLINIVTKRPTSR